MKLYREETEYRTYDLYEGSSYGSYGMPVEVDPQFYREYLEIKEKFEMFQEMLSNLRAADGDS